MSDDFTRFKFAWLEQVADDPGVSPLGFKLAHAIARHLNREKMKAWPTQARLAAAIGATERSVQKLTLTLRDRGHIEVHSGGGRHVSNVYRLVAKTPNHSSPKGFEKPELPFVLSDARPRTTVRKTPNGEGSKPRTTVRPNTLKEPFEEHIEGELLPPTPLNGEKKADAQGNNHRRRPKDATAETFDQFWREYPRRVGKAAARRAFDKAVKGETAPAEVIAAARRYAAERGAVADLAERTRFTKHPATWLNAECWLDEPPVAADGPVIDQHGNPVTVEPPPHRGRRTSEEIDAICGVNWEGWS